MVLRLCYLRPIFAFGAVLYEMVTGRRAFEGKSQISVASAILENEPQPIKDNAALLHHFNEAEVAIGKKDLVAAKMHTDEFRKGAELHENSP